MNAQSQLIALIEPARLRVLIESVAPAVPKADTRGPDLGHVMDHIGVTIRQHLLSVQATDTMVILRNAAEVIGKDDGESVRVGIPQGDITGLVKTLRASKDIYLRVMASEHGVSLHSEIDDALLYTFVSGPRIEGIVKKMDLAHFVEIEGSLGQRFLEMPLSRMASVITAAKKAGRGSLVTSLSGDVKKPARFRLSDAEHWEAIAMPVTKKF